MHTLSRRSSWQSKNVPDTVNLLLAWSGYFNICCVFFFFFKNQLEGSGSMSNWYKMRPVVLHKCSPLPFFLFFLSDMTSTSQRTPRRSPRKKNISPETVTDSGDEVFVAIEAEDRYRFYCYYYCYFTDFFFFLSCLWQP